MFVIFYNMLQTPFNATPRILRSDNGGKYINLAIIQFISNHVMIHQTSCPDTPQQNGIAERKNRTLLEITRALLVESHSPASYCSEAVATATYLTNCLPSKPLHYRTLLETLGSFVSLLSFHSLPPQVFGCIAYIHLLKQTRTKLKPRAIKCVFLGFGVNQKGYTCFDPLHNRMYNTMDCDFFEQSYYYPQPGPQGERVSDDLSWLIYPVVKDLNPKEQVGETIEVVTEDIVSPLLTTPVLEHPIQQEEVIPQEEVILEPQENYDNNLDHVASVDVPNRYKLPPGVQGEFPREDMTLNLRHRDRNI